MGVFGSALTAGGTTGLLYWGLAFFLTGSGLNVTCLNMMLTQRFEPGGGRREGAFLWNYAGMNLGNFLAIILAAANWTPPKAPLTHQVPESQAATT